MPRKSTFMDATVARELMPDCTMERMYQDYGDFHIAISELYDDNIICDFIPVLEITRRL